MELKELQRQAEKILNIKALTQGFDLVSFSHSSFGIPEIKVEGITPARTSSEPAYKTDFGWMYSGEAVIECRKTGIQDSEHRDIYITPQNIVFVYECDEGSPEHNEDDHRIIDPVFE